MDAEDDAAASVAAACRLLQRIAFQADSTNARTYSPP